MFVHLFVLCSEWEVETREKQGETRSTKNSSSSSSAHCARTRTTDEKQDDNEGRGAYARSCMPRSNVPETTVPARGGGGATTKTCGGDGGTRAKQPGEEEGRARSVDAGAPDELLHDLVGAAVDRLHTRIDERAAHRVLPHVAPAPVELHAVVSDLVLEVGAPVLRHRSHRRVELVARVQVDAVVDERAAHDAVGLHLGE